LQAHSKLPNVSVHAAKGEQVSVPSEHSSMLTQPPASSRNPGGQDEQVELLALVHVIALVQ